MENSTVVPENKKSNLRSRMGRPNKGQVAQAPEGPPSTMGEIKAPEVRRQRAAVAPASKDDATSAPRSEPPRSHNRERQPRRRPEGERRPQGEARPEGERAPQGQRRPEGQRRPQRRPAAAAEGVPTDRRIEEKPVELSKSEVYYELPQRKRGEKAAAPEGKGWVRALLSSIFGFNTSKKESSAEAPYTPMHAPEARPRRGGNTPAFPRTDRPRNSEGGDRRPRRSRGPRRPQAPKEGAGGEGGEERKG